MHLLENSTVPIIVGFVYMDLHVCRLKPNIILTSVHCMVSHRSLHPLLRMLPRAQPVLHNLIWFQKISMWLLSCIYFLAEVQSNTLWRLLE